MEIRLHNTLARRVEPFVPLDPARVTMYVCGPTVYNYVHIGNARPPVVFGVLATLLRRRFPQVVYARNITDVDDKINTAARERGVPIADITGRFAAAYAEDMRRLGAGEPDVVPHATTHIPQIIAMVERLIASGHAYAAEGHVLFSVASFPDYGRLSGRDPEELLAGGKLLGLLQQAPADWFGRGSDDADAARIQALVDERAAAKTARDFARADAIRAQLADEGVLLEDTPQGVRWRRG